jgi:hypothetical protein
MSGDLSGHVPVSVAMKMKAAAWRMALSLPAPAVVATPGGPPNDAAGAHC